MNFNKKLFIPLLTLLGALSSCFPFGGVSKSTEPENWFGNYLMFMMFSYRYTSGAYETILVDRLDGTVEVSRRYRRSSGGYYYNYRELLQKCSQGWEYDSGSNGCNRVHEEAELYQYCSTNNNSCNGSDRYLVGLGSSEVYDTCNLDGFQGLGWQGAHKKTLKAILTHPDRDKAFPTLQDNYFWTNESAETTKGRVMRASRLEEYRDKTTRQRVLCQFSGSFF